MQTLHTRGSPSTSALRPKQAAASARITGRRPEFSLTRAAAAARIQSWDAPPVVVAGAGIAGLATALALHKVGVPVRVLEASKDGLRQGEGAAIGLWQNAWRALDVLGVADQLRPSYAKLDKVELVRSTGRTLCRFGFEECDAGKDGQPCEFRGSRRGHLLRVLADSLPPETITCGAKVSKVQQLGGSSASSPWPVVQLEGRGSVEAGFLVAADGARSVVAQEGLGLPMPSYSGYAAYRGVAIPEGGTAELELPLDTIRQVWGEGTRAGLYPLNEKEVYWYTCFNASESDPVPPTPEARQEDACGHVKGWAWCMEKAIRTTPAAAINRSRITDRWTLGAYGRGLITAAGDAAHPMTPNLGQGGCVSLEDAVVLARTIASLPPGQLRYSFSLVTALEQALRQYEQERSARCFPITARSNLMGAALQLPFQPVCAFRDTFVSTAFSPGHFLDHTTFDCGPLLTE